MKRIPLLLTIVLPFTLLDGTEKDFTLKVKKPKDTDRKKANKYAKNLEKEYASFNQQNVDAKKLNQKYTDLTEEIEDISLLIKGAKKIPVDLVAERRTLRGQISKIKKKIDDINDIDDDTSTSEEIQDKVKEYMWNMVVEEDKDGLKNWIEEDNIDMEDVLVYIQNATEEAIGKK